MKKIRVHIYISGRVQGVGYRYSTLNQAEKLGIKGWVRNTHDNRVEAVFEGDKNVVESMVKWCNQGPTMAIVIDIDIHRQEYTGKFTNFLIKG